MALSSWRGLRLLSFLAVLLICSGCSFLGFGPSKGDVINHTIRRGDTLYELGLRYRTTVNAIIASNSDLNPRALVVGQVVRIPVGSQAAAPPSKKPPPVKEGSAGMLRSVPLGRARRYVGELTWPVKGGALSSRFGNRWMTFHEGVDLVKKEGVPILAAHDGEVIYSASGLRGYGNLIVLRGDNLLTIYGHNRRNLVRVGERVRREQQIAELGKSGKATGPHLHFETRVKDTDGKFVAVDPMTFFPGALGD